MSMKKKIILASVIVLLAAGSRLVKHPYNFTPIVALAIFAGCYLKGRWGIILPLLAMLASDYFIGFYNWQLMLPVYIGVAISFFIGRYLAERLKWHNIILSSLSSSLIFFILTNFAVWFFMDWYPHTRQGLLNCFQLAIPFFRNSLIGDIVYTSLFFLAYESVIILAGKTILKKQNLIYKNN